MAKRVLIALMITVLVSGSITYAQVKVLVNNDLRVESQPQQVVVMREVVADQHARQVKEKIAELRAMAREARQQAQQYLAQAEELEQRLRREWESDEVQAQIEKLKVQVLELAAAAKQADKEGIVEKAQELRRRATALAGELKNRVIEFEVQRIREDQVRKEVEIEIRRVIEDELKERRKEPDIEAIERKIRQGFMEAEELRQRGRIEEAERTRLQAEKMAAELGAYLRRLEMKEQDELKKKEDDPDRTREGRQRERVIDELLALVQKEQDLGNMDRAEAIRLEAHRLEMEARMKQLQAELEQSMARLHQAERLGRDEEIAELSRHIDELHRVIAQHEKEIDRQHIEMEIRELHRLAEKEQESGHIEKAEAVRREAGLLEEKFHQEFLTEETVGIEEMLRHEFEKMHDMINGIKGEMEFMRQEIEALKKKIRG